MGAQSKYRSVSYCQDNWVVIWMWYFLSYFVCVCCVLTYCSDRRWLSVYALILAQWWRTLNKSFQVVLFCGYLVGVKWNVLFWSRSMTLISRHFSDDSLSTYLKKILICPVSLSMASQNSEHLASLCSVYFLRYQSQIFFAVSALPNPLPPPLCSFHYTLYNHMWTS